MSGTKKIIDSWVSDNYERILLLCRARAAQFNRGYEGDIVVSYVYEYLIMNIDKVTKDNIESIAFNFINMSFYWTRSSINKIEIQTATPFENNIEFKPYMLNQEDDELNDKISFEMWLSDSRAVLDLYMVKIKSDKVKYRFLEVMIREKIHSVADLARYFNITYYGADKRYKEIVKELCEFRKELKHYNKLYNIK